MNVAEKQEWLEAVRAELVGRTCSCADALTGHARIYRVKKVLDIVPASKDDGFTAVLLLEEADGSQRSVRAEDCWAVHQEVPA